MVRAAEPETAVQARNTSQCANTHNKAWSYVSAVAVAVRSQRVCAPDAKAPGSMPGGMPEGNMGIYGMPPGRPG
jgi:hypothetical protein